MNFLEKTKKQKTKLGATENWHWIPFCFHGNWHDEFMLFPFDGEESPTSELIESIVFDMETLAIFFFF